MKSNILQQVSAVQAETVVRVQQLSNVIAEASSVISEVTVEAQVIIFGTGNVGTYEIWGNSRLTRGTSNKGGRSMF